MVRSAKIVVVSFLLIISVGFFGSCHSEENAISPERVLSKFVEAVQAKDGLSLFDLDSAAPKTTGLFKDEIQDKKTKYVTSVIAVNPSICPDGTGNKYIPCDGSGSSSSSVRLVQLLIPKGSQYVIAEKVFSDPPKNTVARILVKIVYPGDTGPIFVSNMKAIQIYKGGITPVPPLFGDSDTGIVQRGNPLLGVTRTNDQWKFPITFDAKGIKEATIEAQLEKSENGWRVRTVKWNHEKLVFSGDLRKSGVNIGNTVSAGTDSKTVTTDPRGLVGEKIGGEVRTLTQKEIDYYRTESGSGVVITNIEEDGPLDKAGFEVNDIILEIEGQTVMGLERFFELVSSLHRNQRVKLLAIDNRTGKKGYLQINVR